MRIASISVIVGALCATTQADCRHPNGNVQTDPYHAPCAEVLNNPLNTMCCAIERPNPTEGLSKNGLAADVCLPNGLCKQSWMQDENSTLQTHYYREECTVTDWKNGKCLTVCLSNSVCIRVRYLESIGTNIQQAARNVRMMPCDDTANSTRWCCGDNKDCCAGDVGVETLAQTFLGDFASATLSPSSSATTAISSNIASSSPSSSSSSISSASERPSTLSGGAIAGIVVGAVAGLALIGTAWFFFASRRKSANQTPPLYVEEGYPNETPKESYAYEADGSQPQVSEVPASNGKNDNAAARVHELQ